MDGTPMKIAHVVDYFEIGGSQVLVSQLCRLQREQGHDPCVYVVIGLGLLGEQMRAEGFAVRSDVARHLSDGVRNFLRIFKMSQPDVVHLHDPLPTIYAAMAARMAGVPSIVSTRHSLVAPPRKVVEELKYAFAARCCDWVVGICDATADNLRSMRSAPLRKIVCVYNGAAPIQRAANEDWPQKSGFTLLYAGRLETVKNLPLLLNAFRAALASKSDLRLWMVGDGSERERLESLAADLGIAGQVKFWGQQLDVAPFFSAADAFVMSSNSEGLPISLLEAFSLGLPVIVTDVGGMAEAVRLAKAGLTVPVADPAEMAAAILRMAANTAEREHFSANAQSAFHAQFTLQAMVDAYMKLYRNTPRARRMARA